MSIPTILIVDDDPSIRFAFQKTFEPKHYRTIEAENGRRALEIIPKEKPSVIFMDIMMPDVDGLEVLERIKKLDPNIPVIMITGFGTMQTAMRAIKLGAYEYMTKPLDIDKVRLLADRALEMLQLREELKDYKEKISLVSDGYELIGQSEAMQEVYKKMGAAAGTPNSTVVLIHGESGTGKELVARAIHQNGHHPTQPFVAVNCTALPENLFESELFGYEKGAFTGAYDRKIGLIEQAGEGTVFLDEIGDLSLHLQQKLLRVLQEREFTRLGGNKAFPVKARFIAATNKVLEEAVKKGEFREDLFYRLNVLSIELPPLRERKEDIPLLVNFFLNRSKKKLKKNIRMATPELIEVLKNYEFAGNVRELENMIERAVILEKGEILSLNSFKGMLKNDSPAFSDRMEGPLSSVVFQEARKAWIDEFEKRFIQKRLRENRGNVTNAAKQARLQRQSFQRLMRKHGIRSEDFRK